jgi:putative endonuclease
MDCGKDYRQTIGRKGEDIACRFLEGKGHKILERNFRSGHLEIDIISQDSLGIHFVEVKTRRMNVQAPPQDNVDIGKQKRIVSAAKKYLSACRPAGSEECFFDVAAITFEGDTARIEWIPQAYIPIYL